MILAPLLSLLACSKGPPTADTDPPTPVDTDTDVTETAIVHTGDTAEPPTPVCDALLPVPVPFQSHNGFGGSEDFDIDMLGRHVSINGSGNLVARDPITGATQLLSPNVTGSAACTRMLPSGNFVVCDVAGNSLVHVDITTGAKNTLVTGMAYPNGAEVDPDGFVYVAEQNAGRVRRVDSTTGEFTTIAENLNNPNGVIFSPDYQILYVGSFGGGVVYAVDRTGVDTFDPPRVLVQDPGNNGGFDGINVDECGNVYITEFVAGKVYRITPDGQIVNLVADLPSSWIPNLRWGNGVNGWEETTLYVSDRSQGRLFALEMGLRGKPGFLTPP
ncbi:MAG: SMP-30/gluconolactonase/LRE family protein [Myxococcota bacterium]